MKQNCFDLKHLHLIFPAAEETCFKKWLLKNLKAFTKKKLVTDLKRKLLFMLKSVLCNFNLKKKKEIEMERIEIEIVEIEIEDKWK